MSTRYLDDQLARVRYDLSRLKQGQQQESATTTLRELLDAGYTFDLGDAIKRVEGKSVAECNRIIGVIKRCCKPKGLQLRNRNLDDTIHEVTVVGPELMKRSAQYSMKGIHKPAIEIRADIEADLRAKNARGGR